MAGSETFKGQVTIDLSGPNWWTTNNPTIGGESLIVKHTENGRAPAVSFMNDGGGHFVQRFLFGADSSLPGREAASLWANWAGLVVAAHSNLSFVIGSLDNAPQMEIGTGNVHVLSDLNVDGNINVTGDIVLANQDCAEDFDVSRSFEIEQGTVVVIDQEGVLEPSQQAYDKRVAGVISGAGDYRPAITLGKQPSETKRLPVALLGKVCCKVDAQYAPIEVGDLLTTSPSLGYAIKALDPLKAFGRESTSSVENRPGTDSHPGRVAIVATRLSEL